MTTSTCSEWSFPIKIEAVKTNKQEKMREFVESKLQKQKDAMETTLRTKMGILDKEQAKILNDDYLEDEKKR